MNYINRCQAKIPTGEFCPSEAHKKMEIGDKEVPLCSHHMRVIAAKQDYYKSQSRKAQGGVSRDSSVKPLESLRRLSIPGLMTSH